MAALEAERDKTLGRSSSPTRAPRPRKGLAAHLVRVEVVIAPDDPAGCEGLERIRAFESRIQAVTPDAILAAARRYFHRELLVEGIVRGAGAAG